MKNMSLLFILLVFHSKYSQKSYLFIEVKLLKEKKTVFPQNMGATIIGTPKKSAWKRTCVYIDPTHREEDGSTGKKISKDHSWRIAEVS